MVESGGHRTSAQKAGKSAGQREKRLAQERRRQNRESNVYRISIVPSIIEGTKYESRPMFGICKEDGTWHLTAMTLKRKESGRKDPVDKSQWGDRFEICKVDRDNYLKFLRSQNTITL